MNKIYRADTRHVTVEEAKRLIREARQWGEPGDLAHAVYVREDGTYDVREAPEDLHGLYVADDFLRDCQHLRLMPFDKYRPSLGVVYPGGTEADSSFAIKYVDFVRLAELYGLEVALGDAPPEAAAPPAQSVTPDLDWSQLATRGQLITAFGPHTGMNLSWFDNVRDTPALLAARRWKGTAGHKSTEPLFCPFEVMRWLVSPKRKKGRSMSETMGWKLLQSHFASVYASRSIGDPRGDYRG